MARAGLAIVLLLCAQSVWADEPISETWDYTAAMKRVAAGFRGKTGVVLHVGDSITYANPYGQWARNGAGKTPAQQAVLDWMHTNANNDSDGWYLCRFDHPDGGRSYTAAGGLRANELLVGGRQKLPPLRDLLAKYQPQMVVVMVGTNDASAQRAIADYIADMGKVVDQVLARKAICILSTIPPHVGQPDLAKAYNEGLRALARTKQVPLIDYEAEILKRRPDDWNGTLLNKDDVHPSASLEGTTPTSPPSEANLKNSGYLLRGWLTVEKVREVKERILDPRAPVESAPVADSTRPTPRKPPSGEVIRVPVNRDTWFSTVRDQADTNTGGASRLKFKSYQEFSLVDIDPKPLKGRTIVAATLHLKIAGSEVLRRVSVSSFASDWVEGTAESYSAQQGSSTFNSRMHPQRPWAWSGSDLTAVTLGNGNTWWWMADAFPPDDQGWQKIAVEPALIEARVAGVSQGFLVFDDTGSEWSREGEKVTIRHMPNRYAHSRESGPMNEPWFEITLGPPDNQPPVACGDMRVESGTANLPPGEALLSWITPADAGGAGTVGFLVEVNDQPLPQYLVPMAAAPGQRVLMHLRDVEISSGGIAAIRIRPVDGAGNLGPATLLRAKTSGAIVPALAGTPPTSLRPGTKLPRLGQAEVAIIDALDKVTPSGGVIIPQQFPTYLLGNHLWSAREPMIQLHSARNEFVDFQVLFRGQADGVQAELNFRAIDPRVRFGEYHHVPTPSGPMPDPILHYDGLFRVPDPKEGVENQRHGSLYCEVYVPHGAPSGIHRGTLKLTSGTDSLEIPVTLTVWDFMLPDRLSFLPEMNCYSLPENERDYYRLAHAHRTVLNRVPYSQRGEIDDGCAPRWDGRTLDFQYWDRRFGPYLDGSAFEDLPRKNVPVECFYLPLHENWPSLIDQHYNGSYWADEAFSKDYRRALVSAVQQFASHITEKGWNRTLFHAFLNNKVDYKGNGWSRGSSPWLLDEPANFQDFWALKFFGEAVQSAQGDGRHPILFRADVSRPQWQRDSLDAVLDYNVVANSAFRNYRRLVLDRKHSLGQVLVEYGSSNGLLESNLQPAAWCVDAWTLGTDGVVPWQTVGTANSWKSADPQSLFYPAGHFGQELPVPSIRLKAYRRGQQDVEYLTLLTHALRQPRWITEHQVREALQMAARPRGTGATTRDDAGIVEFSQLKPEHLWSLRLQVAEALSRRRPETLPPIPDWKPRPQNRHSRGGYVTVGEVPDPSELATPSNGNPK